MHTFSQGRAASIDLSEAIGDSITDSRERSNVSQDSFRTLYGLTNRPLWAYLLRVSGRRDVADDLVQETYCRFLAARLPEMDAAESRGYLFRIATNLLHDHWRKRQAPGAVSSAVQSCEEDPETRTDVRRCFGRLKPRDRQLLWLAYVEGFDHKEIARVTGLRVASVRVLLFHARAQLAAALRHSSQSGGKV
jgi:RNA polymerase sigma-70 factor, ECF subfamily